MSKEIAIRVDDIVRRLLAVIDSWPEHARTPLQLATRVEAMVGELREAIEGYSSPTSEKSRRLLPS